MQAAANIQGSECPYHHRESLCRPGKLPAWNPKASDSDTKKFVNRRSSLALPPLPPNGIKYHVEVSRASTKQDVKNMFKILYKHEQLRPELGRPNWDKRSKPWEVLGYMFGLYETLLPENATWRLDSEGAILNYANYEVQGAFMPADFLPGLKKENKELHDFILNTFRMLFSKDGANLNAWFDECSGTVDWLENILLDDEPENPEIKDTIQEYTHIAQEYLDLLTMNCPPKKFKRILNRYAKQPHSPIEKEWIGWATKAYELSVEHAFSDFLSQDDPQNEGLSPWQYIRFFWCVEDDDYMFRYKMEEYGESEGNFGAEPMVFTQTITADNDQLASDSKKPDWPDKLIALVEEGNELVERSSSWLGRVL